MSLRSNTLATAIFANLKAAEKKRIVSYLTRQHDLRLGPASWTLSHTYVEEARSSETDITHTNLLKTTPLATSAIKNELAALPIRGSQVVAADIIPKPTPYLVLTTQPSYSTPTNTGDSSEGTSAPFPWSLDLPSPCIVGKQCPKRPPPTDARRGHTLSLEWPAHSVH
ncbi:hypothetical protein BDK51DRAFT_37117 [Blyttiomyces helicus]|uniref:Uncharacterized protein n=1 Tax=Blyttiomyces helicus TaxID=388810 RepID=A0A4P9W4Q0_9FUNG|nr:hypothetical protein BDK51DRAFT_37117 [Blyttiomyces helicus]|eukprot:RKO86263.1 hypothetical protein BDK51DRAFT_37117 [Blyttiomyces helicus]